jgi:hypothetical protein
MHLFNSAEYAKLEQKSLSASSSSLVSGSITFKNLLNSHRETMCLMLQVLTQTVFLGETPVFFHLSRIGLFGTT